MKLLTVAEMVDQVLAVVKPRALRAPGTAPLSYVPPNEHPAACRFCGDPCTVEILDDAGRVRVAVSHDVPACPEFVRACEDRP